MPPSYQPNYPVASARVGRELEICRWPDSNRHGRLSPTDFKSVASAISPHRRSGAILSAARRFASEPFALVRLRRTSGGSGLLCGRSSLLQQITPQLTKNLKLPLN